MVMTQQKYAVSAKIWQVSEMSWFSKNTLCQPKLAELSKCLMITRQKIAELAKICCHSPAKYAVSNNVSLSRSTTYFDPTLTDCLSCVDFDRHLVSVSSSGAHFDCCAYIIDL